MAEPIKVLKNLSILPQTFIYKTDSETEQVSYIIFSKVPYTLGLYGTWVMEHADSYLARYTYLTEEHVAALIDAGYIHVRFENQERGETAPIPLVDLFVTIEPQELNIDIDF